MRKGWKSERDKKMTTPHGFRTNSNWRYRVIKKYRRRAIKFRELSKTKEEFAAWDQVVTWFESILKQSFVNQNDSIGLPMIWIENKSE